MKSKTYPIFHIDGRRARILRKELGLPSDLKDLDENTTTEKTQIELALVAETLNLTRLKYDHLAGHDAFLCGGALTAWIGDYPPSDYDFFVPTLELAERLHHRLLYQGAVLDGYQGIEDGQPIYDAIQKGELHIDELVIEDEAVFKSFLKITTRFFGNNLKMLHLFHFFHTLTRKELHMTEKLKDEELRPAILRWIEMTQQLDKIGHQLGRIKEQYAELQYPDEIESLAELEPVDRRKRELAVREHDLRGRSCRLGNEQAKLDDLIRATLPVNVWYRVDGHRLRWVSDATPRLVYEEVRELERAA